MFDEDVIFGRMGVGTGGDPSEFDYAARDEADMTPEQAEYLFAGDLNFSAPPAAGSGSLQFSKPPAAKMKGGPSPEIAAQLAAAQAHLAAVREMYNTYRATGKLPTAVAPTYPYDPGYYDPGYATDGGYGPDEVPMSAAASEALQRFRDSGGAYDPFEDEADADEVLGAAVADVLIDKWEAQITDAPLDFERGRGSAHRGAAYLQQNGSYPPWGASSGQEGGAVLPEPTFEVLGSIGLGRTR